MGRSDLPRQSDRFPAPDALVARPDADLLLQFQVGLLAPLNGGTLTVLPLAGSTDAVPESRPARIFQVNHRRPQRCPLHW